MEGHRYYWACMPYTRIECMAAIIYYCACTIDMHVVHTCMLEHVNQ